VFNTIFFYPLVILFDPILYLQKSEPDGVEVSKVIAKFVD